MIRILVKSLYILMLGFIFISGALIFFLTTNEGLNSLIILSKSYLPGKLTVKKINGTLYDKVVLEELSYREKGLRISIQSLQLNWQPTSLGRHALDLQWDKLIFQKAQNETIQIPGGTLKAHTNWPQLNIVLDTQLIPLANQNFQLKMVATGSYPWQWTIGAQLNDLQKSPTKIPGLHTNIILKSTIRNEKKGTLSFKIFPGYYQIPDNDSIPAFEFQGGLIKMDLNSRRLASSGELSIDSSKKLNMDFQLPQFSLSNGLTDSQKIRGNLILFISSLDFLENISPEITKLKGQLTATLKISGKVNKPLISGDIVLAQTSLSLPKLGLNLNSVDLNVISKSNSWETSGLVISGGHSLVIKGKGRLVPTYGGEIYITGKEFPLITRDEYKINISPELKIDVTPNLYTISGKIGVPSAQIKPQSFSNSVELPEEVVFKKNNIEKSNSSSLNTKIDVGIEIGKEVSIDTKGLKGRLEGQLNIKQIPQGGINAYGELSVKDGTYKAYNQNLTITRGQLIFTGGLITNPGINIRAAKTINNNSSFTNASQLFDFNNGNLQSINMGDHMSLGVEATGRLNKPKIQLFSDPAILSQADILSMLVLGRTANQADKAGGQLLFTALTSMNIGDTNSSKLLEQLKQSSGFDFDIQNNINYNQSTRQTTDSQSFMVGKSLSKRLYLSYNIGLSQSEANMLTLKYLLNKFFSIQVSNSTNSNGIDFLYTGSKK